MTAILVNRAFKPHHELDALSDIPLEPSDYCSKWVPKLWHIEQGERGYRKACMAEIARVTSISKNTINTWGSDFSDCPSHVKQSLRMADIINTIRELIQLPPNMFSEDE